MTDVIDRLVTIRFPGRGWLGATVRRALRIPTPRNYREWLFADLAGALDQRPRRILEIGPKDGIDTRRLLTLDPDVLTLVDLPRRDEANAKWLGALADPRIEYISANFMYSPEVEDLRPFDLVWCSGVLYHNPEQLRMIRKLFNLTASGGSLVLESATTRRSRLVDERCIEVIFPPDESYQRKWHVSRNVTHLPSRRAIEAWLGMIGFTRIRRSDCHRRQSRTLARYRAAFICKRPAVAPGGLYYATPGAEAYLIGGSR